MPISKTDFVRGLQCEKMLWLDAHAPELKIIPPEIQAKLDAGNEFGDKAMGIFGAFVETTTYREDGKMHYAAMLEKTQSFLQSGEPVICEAAFTWYGNYCAADILRREGDGYVLYEVKNAYAARKEFVTDLGFQRLILRKCGVNLLATKLILRGDAPPTDLAPCQTAIEETREAPIEFIEHEGFRYKIVDVTKAARSMEFVASKRIFELGKLKKKEVCMPKLPVGAHCDSPYRCWYYEHCHKTEE